VAALDQDLFGAGAGHAFGCFARYATRWPDLPAAAIDSAERGHVFAAWYPISPPGQATLGTG